MKNKIILIFKYSMLIGAISVALIFIFGQNTSVLIQQELLPNSAVSWYKFDVHAYLEQIQTNVTDTTKLQFIWQSKEWSYTPDWAGLINNLAYMVNVIIATINVLLYPLKVGGYAVIFAMSILGINTGTESGLHWLYVFGDTMLDIQIPYIP